MRAVAVNSGCANAVTGEDGLLDAREMARLAAEAVGCESREVAVASTGVIGHRLPMDKVGAGIWAASQRLSAETDAGAALAIMTTDTRPKTVTADLMLSAGTARLGGICKGSGMIAPNMATMLGFLTTDAAVAPDALQARPQRRRARHLQRRDRGWRHQHQRHGDPARVRRRGQYADRGGKPGLQGLLRVPDSRLRLAGSPDRLGRRGRHQAGDPRGVRGGDRGRRKKIARTVCESPLTKTALFGNDPNWGRILAAAGPGRRPVRPGEGRTGDRRGIAPAGRRPRSDQEKAARAAIAREEVEIRLNLHGGPGRAVMYTCDFSYDYVRINAEYHT